MIAMMALTRITKTVLMMNNTWVILMITMKAKVSDSKELLSSFISTSCLLTPQWLGGSPPPRQKQEPRGPLLRQLPVQKTRFSATCLAFWVRCKPCSEMCAHAETPSCASRASPRLPRCACTPCRRERLSSLFSPPQKTLGPTPPYPAPPSHCVQLSPPSSIQLLRAVCLFSFLTESEHRHEEFRTKRITHY